MKTLVIIPCYNESENIEALIGNLSKYGYDYLIINDCSKDNTKEILRKNDFSHLDLPINLGLAGVTRVGIKYAADHDYDCVMCIDGDGQHPPKYISTLIDAIEEGNDYVVGSRFVDEKKPWSMRMLGSRLLCLCIKLKTGKTISDPTSGMRALGKKVIQDFADSMNFYAEPDALCYLLHKGYQVKEVQVEMKEREAGESYFANPFKSIYFMMATLLSIIFIR
ncbi:MAG: glycosyltransferase family 2 protein [Erysipelotrichaceae bacterium]|nr:glycosyltransferase family 2 protein [Erysipelotrichaceae bacterium]